MAVNLLKHMYLSITNLEWYAVLHAVSLKKHLTALLLTLVCGACLLSVRLTLIEIPRIFTNLTQVYTDSSQHFPDDLVISWTDNRLSINTSSLTIPIPNLLAENDLYGTEQHISVSATELDLETVQKMLLESEYVVDPRTLYFYNYGTVTPIALSELIQLNSFVLDKEHFLSTFSSWLDSGKDMRYLLSIVLPVIVFPLLAVTRTISLLLDTATIYLILRLTNNRLSIHRVFLLVINVMIPSEFIFQLNNIYMNDTNTPLYSIVYWIYLTVAIIYIQYRKKTS